MASDISEFRVSRAKCSAKMATNKPEITLQNAPAKFTTKVWKHLL